jgi:glucose-1-phosphate thymidylyltransferase
VVVLRHGKEDVAQVLEQQKILPVEIVWTEATPSVPHTLARAGESLRGHRVALGFPDILFEPLDAFAALDRRQQDSSADVVLGLFPSDRPGATDMVQLDAASRPIDIVIKDPDCTLEYTWQMALWTPRFTDFLCAAVSRQLSPQLAEVELAEVELQVGDVLRTAIAQGLAIEAVVFDQGSSLDVGTETTLARVDPSHFS